MKKKFSDLLLVSDFDGTLFYQTEVPQANVSAINYFIENGGVFTVCTGRSCQSLEQHMHEFPSNAPPIVANGAMIYDYKKKEAVDRRDLLESARALLYRVMEKFPKLGVEVYTIDSVYIAQDSAWVKSHMDYDKIFNEKMPLDIIPGEWVKVILTGDPDGMGEVENFLNECNDPDIEYVFTAPYFLELFYNGVNKGSGLELLTQYLGLDMKDTFAVGDYLNDVDLLKTARHSYAVIGAPTELLEVSDAVVCSAQEGSVANVIKLLDNIY